MTQRFLEMAERNFTKLEVKVVKLSHKDKFENFEKLSRFAPRPPTDRPLQKRCVVLPPKI